MLKSRRSAVAFAAAFLAAHGAFAFEGRYVAGDKAYRQELEIKKRADGGFDLTAVVGTEGCSGYVDARGRPSDAASLPCRPRPLLAVGRWHPVDRGSGRRLPRRARDHAQGLHSRAQIAIYVSDLDHAAVAGVASGSNAPPDSRGVSSTDWKQND